MAGLSLYRSVMVMCILAVVAAQNEGLTTHLYSTGVKGEKGAQGLTGQKGAPGFGGFTGLKGVIGATGSPGTKGAAGDNGIPGLTYYGSTGAIGPPGQIGNTGGTGATGMAGATGAPGQLGLIGLKGVKGPTGVAGIQGVTGSLGSPGLRGPSGSPGSDGARGEQGLPGPQGENGRKGERGSSGDSLQSVLAARNKTCATLQCDQGKCEETLVGAICKCNEGYEFVPGDNTKCQDINECRQGVCAYNCINTMGDFSCACPSGYTMQSNNECEKDTTNCVCTSEEQCVRLASGPQCLPTTISINQGGASAASALGSKRLVEVPYDRGDMLNESWMIIFIVWGAVLTVIIVALIIWLIQESRMSTGAGKEATEYHQYPSINGSTLPRMAAFTPAPSIVYSTSNRKMPALSYANPNYATKGKELIIYN